MIKKITCTSWIAVAAAAGVLAGCGAGGGNSGGMDNVGTAESDSFFNTVMSLIASSSTEDALAVPIDNITTTMPEDKEPVSVI